MAKTIAVISANRLEDAITLAETQENHIKGPDGRCPPVDGDCDNPMLAYVSREQCVDYLEYRILSYQIVPKSIENYRHGTTSGLE